MMPELGRNLLDEAGSALVAKWIGEMEPTPCQGEGHQPWVVNWEHPI